MLTLTQYITYRLGRTPKEQAINFLAKPFGAKSLTEFWHCWNPVWGYYLLYYCYRPLRNYFPRGLSVWLTFFACGLVHDLPFVIPAYLTSGQLPFFTLTVFFSLMGGMVVITEKARLQFVHFPTAFRWIIHGTFLFFCYRVALVLTMR